MRVLRLTRRNSPRCASLQGQWCAAHVNVRTAPPPLLGVTDGSACKGGAPVTETYMVTYTYTVHLYTLYFIHFTLYFLLLTYLLHFTLYTTFGKHAKSTQANIFILGVTFRGSAQRLKHILFPPVTDGPVAPPLEPCAAGPATPPLEPHKLSTAVVRLLGEEILHKTSGNFHGAHDNAHAGPGAHTKQRSYSRTGWLVLLSAQGLLMWNFSPRCVTYIFGTSLQR